MPKVIKPIHTYDPLKRLLRGYMSASEVSAAIRRTEKTARERIRNPEKLTVEELHRLRLSGVAKEELIEALGRVI